MDPLFFVSVAVGFAAQLIDGALGMAYGVSASTFLIATGVPPTIASASVHAAETVTTAANGISHLYHGNVDKRLLLRLAIPGVIGGVLGALALVAINDDRIRPVIALYLVVMGVIIVRRALRNRPQAPVAPKAPVAPTGFVGGFLDAVGGGGWGPIVVSTLLGTGHRTQQTIGTSCAAEFIVSLGITITFLLTVSVSSIVPVPAIGLMIGGVLAAPFTGYLVRRIPERWLMLSVGLLIIILATSIVVTTLL